MAKASNIPKWPLELKSKFIRQFEFSFCMENIGVEQDQFFSPSAVSIQNIKQTPVVNVLTTCISELDVSYAS